jgi:hypothetical protein
MLIRIASCGWSVEQAGRIPKDRLSTARAQNSRKSNRSDSKCTSLNSALDLGGAVTRSLHASPRLRPWTRFTQRHSPRMESARLVGSVVGGPDRKTSLLTFCCFVAFRSPSREVGVRRVCKKSSTVGCAVWKPTRDGQSSLCVCAKRFEVSGGGSL